MRKKREKFEVADHPTIEEYESLNNLAEVISEDKQKNLDPTEDPFTHYVHHVQAKMHDNTHLFRTRFEKGYQVLLEELKHT